MARPVGRRSGEARDRLLHAALALFVEHGVSGTSLQMIADNLGVTKAAVYHQFATKDEIVLAVLQPVVDEMTAFVTRAEAGTDRGEQVDVILRGIVELVVGHRYVTTVLSRDPAAAIKNIPGIASLAPRISVLLNGPAPDARTRVATGMMGAGVLALGNDPALADLDDDTLRRELLAAARRLVGPTIT